MKIYKIRFKWVNPKATLLGFYDSLQPVVQPGEKITFTLKEEIDLWGYLGLEVIGLRSRTVGDIRNYLKIHNIDSSVVDHIDESVEVELTGGIEKCELRDIVTMASRFDVNGRVLAMKVHFW